MHISAVFHYTVQHVRLGSMDTIAPISAPETWESVMQIAPPPLLVWEAMKLMSPKQAIVLLESTPHLEWSLVSVHVMSKNLTYPTISTEYVPHDGFAEASRSHVSTYRSCLRLSAIQVHMSTCAFVFL